MRRLVIVLALVVTATVAATASAQIPMPALPDNLRCLIDNKPVNPESKLHVKFIWDDGSVKYVNDLEEIDDVMIKYGDHIKAAYVYDQNTGNEVLASKAFALVNSKIKPPKCGEGVYIVFYEKKEDADAARKKFGGRVEPMSEKIKKLVADTCKVECETKCNAIAVPAPAPVTPAAAPAAPAK